ncbi:MAG: glycine betaine/L-proline ABC transporter ATP-binding protein [Bacteroidales bacterium]
MSKIKVENLSVIFGKRVKQARSLLTQNKSKEEILKATGCTVGVNNANFEIYKGEVFVIMGLSGSGKSTLLRTINRLIDPTAGTVIVDEHNVTEADEEGLRNIRRTQMSMVFQHFGLLPHRTVASNVAFGLEIQGVPEEERLKKAVETLKTVGLEGYEYMMTGELSGGMQQRVGLARALATDPEVLLMDEAFSALDPLIRNNMQDELLALQDKLHKTIVFITHDLDEALKIGDRIAIMKDGVIVQTGTPEQILTNPADDYVRSFVENVDRSTIVTARTVMFDKPERIRLHKEGPNAALRKMRKMGVTSLPVVDEENHFLGFVKASDMKEMLDKELDDLKAYMYTKKEVNAVHPDTPVGELLPLFLDTSLNLAVVDTEKKLLGVAVHSAVIGEMVGMKREQVKQLKEDGGIDL